MRPVAKEIGVSTATLGPMFVYPIGTRVRLASGGPEMIVVDLDEDRANVLCAWRRDRHN